MGYEEGLVHPEPPIFKVSVKCLLRQNGWMMFYGKHDEAKCKDVPKKTQKRNK
jgi:hypothetical protein